MPLKVDNQILIDFNFIHHKSKYNTKEGGMKKEVDYKIA